MHDIPDIEKRIAFHRRRIARRPPRTPEPVRCWACKATVPSGQKPEKYGWRTRPFEDGVSAHMKELYCPACFSRWGWGDDLPRA